MTYGHSLPVPAPEVEPGVRGRRGGAPQPPTLTPSGCRLGGVEGTVGGPVRARRSPQERIVELRTELAYLRAELETAPPLDRGRLRGLLVSTDRSLRWHLSRGGYTSRPAGTSAAE